ncbi:ubiquitin carboxyl-terminal hydrolase [Zychaea mexicana]|uniref:ubiquitin carboxyl-terminal hydrolase n=1 Tax=Zychaea mexicana TaxID=64656 RepID=UPI0022FF1191|nr:ubiquitin carboxyl-terminal hydrolase [Zychaea mexicana]KAI9492433.1 ubiquitin carboxyl-terminal hydrolase [Zychaea mexicana]
MAQRESLEDDPWLLIEPDPGSLSQLCTRMGVKGVQVEPIPSLNRDFIRDLRPIYGITLLLRHKPEKSHRDEMYTTNNNVYFVNQVVHDAYAMYAMLSVLLNREESIDLGSELLNFKEFTGDFPPMLKGLSVTNSKALKDAHNGVGRRSPRRPARGDNTYHYISYLPIGGHLWELDGFKRGPLRLVPCTENSWLDAARAELQRKLDMYQRQQIPFSVWSIIEDRRQVYQRRLVRKAYLRSAIERQLDYCDPSWRTTFRAQQWEDEYKHALETFTKERCKRGAAMHILYPTCRSVEDLPAQDRAELDAEIETSVVGRPVQELVDLWLQNQDDSIRLYARLSEELEKHESHEHNTSRRQHDYTPFIRTFISRLVARGHLQRMVADIS